MLELMHETTFEQISVPSSLISAAQLPFLQDGMLITIGVLRGDPAVATLPTSAWYTVVSGGERGRKDSTVVLENGEKVKAPGYVSAGDSVEVRLENLEYAGYVKGGKGK
jgi:hypothetical protein